MNPPKRLATSLHAAAGAAALAASAPAQVIEVVRLPATAPAFAPTAVPSYGAAPILNAPAANLGAPAETHETILGDPALTKNLTERAETIWALAPQAAKSRPAFRAALHAADYTAARALLDAVEAGETRRLGVRAYQMSDLAPAVAVMRLALQRPDHPAVASLRAGLQDARALHEDGWTGRAMRKADAALRAFHDGPLARHAHRWAVSMPLIRLQGELRERAIDVYEAQTEARALQLDRSAAGVRAWLEKRRSAEPAAVAGGYNGEPVAVQKWSDCALQALWNLPALSALRARSTYKEFAARAEKILNEDIRADGLNESSSRRLLKALGWARSYDAAPKSEEDLVRKIAENGGVIGGYGFKMTRWRALFTTGSFDRSFSHAVALPAAVRAGGRWWFVVLDSGYSRPRLFTYGELLTLNLKIATVAKL